MFDRVSVCECPYVCVHLSICVCKGVRHRVFKCMYVYECMNMFVCTSIYESVLCVFGCMCVG